MSEQMAISDVENPKAEEILASIADPVEREAFKEAVTLRTFLDYLLEFGVLGDDPASLNEAQRKHIVACFTEFRDAGARRNGQ